MMSHSQKHMMMTGSLIGDDGASSLAAGLGLCPLLSSLDLSGNTIGDAGACRLVEKVSPKPQTLNPKP